jgi:sigma-E factor negative regulatory protein RseA
VTEQLKQSISALLDDEISEIEVHRLLREFDSESELKSAELKGTWVRFQQIRAVSQGHHHLSESQHLALHSKISAAIADEDHHQWTGQTRPAWQKPAAGLAVAASLVVAVLVGINTQQQTTPTASDFVADTQTQVINATPVSTNPDVSRDDNAAEMVAFNEDELELRELDVVKQQQLREYLMRHDRMSQMNQMNNHTRTVTFPANGVLNGTLNVPQRETSGRN